MIDTTPTPNEAAPVTFWVRKGDTMIELPGAVAAVAEAMLRVAGRTRKRVVSHSRPVRVVAIDEAKVAEHQKAHGRARMVQVGQTFPSALEASRHLGYAANTVDSALSTARRLKTRMAAEYGANEQSPTPIRATVRGITFEFVEAQ